ncbi:hypothetical protein Y1Q_0002989 [Alligator mississippiensis]|uniref:Uncharacterized protein n=1 Tax=Alligator mississippiensis TaxID=8496 RepID=A0A151MD16_ALLMI|nr:hypothetical protein Y1Q_0002989 [Alligator mississippiensis]
MYRAELRQNETVLISVLLQEQQGISSFGNILLTPINMTGYPHSFEKTADCISTIYSTSTTTQGFSPLCKPAGEGGSTGSHSPCFEKGFARALRPEKGEVKQPRRHRWSAAHWLILSAITGGLTRQQRSAQKLNLSYIKQEEGSHKAEEAHPQGAFAVPGFLPSVYLSLGGTELLAICSCGYSSGLGDGSLSSPLSQAHQSTFTSLHLFFSLL